MRISNQKRKRIVELLTTAFDDNQSVNYIVPQDSRRAGRIGRLMDYACRICETYGEVILSADKNSCALVLLPHTKKFSLKSFYWDLKLIFTVTGIRNVVKVMAREKQISKRHPSAAFYYLWFIAVDPAKAGKGLGSELLNQLIAQSQVMNLPFYLETSTAKNIPWYRKHGFQIFDELDLGYKLYFMRR